VAEELELTIVTMTFDASDPEGLAGVLANYVVVTRMVPGCRNVDWCASLSTPGRFLVVEKWENPAAQRAHLDAPGTVTMAEGCRGRLRRAPAIELYEAISAHDLR